MVSIVYEYDICIPTHVGSYPGVIEVLWESDIYSPFRFSSKQCALFIVLELTFLCECLLNSQGPTEGRDISRRTDHWASIMGTALG